MGLIRHAKKVWMLSIPLAALLALAVACGGDDATPTTGPTATAVPAPTATEVFTEGAGRGRTFVGTPTVPGAMPEATSAGAGDDFQPGDRRIVGTLVEINYGEPKYGGRANILMGGTVRSWDLQGDNKSTPDVSPLSNTLLQFNPWTFDRYDIWGDLAESWKQLDADGTAWEFKLKPHAIWWDGTPVTAEDVVFSFERMVGNTPNHTEGLGRDPRNYVKPHYDHGEVVDQNTVKIFLDGPWADFLGFMANDLIVMLPKGHYEDLDARAQEDPGLLLDPEQGWKNVMASGPFKPTYVRPGAAEWGYDKNPTYWKLDPEGRNLPYLDGLDLIVITDRTATQAAWEAGQLDDTLYQTNGGMGPGQMKEMIEQGGGRFVTYPAGCCPTGLLLNHTKPPFDDWRVRRAIMLGIDRQKQNELAFSGLGFYGTFCGPSGHPLCMTEEEVLALPGFRPDKAADRAEARRLLAEAGYENGFQTTFAVPNWLGWSDMGPVLKDDFGRNLGIDVDLLVMERVAFNEIQKDGQYDMAFFVHGAGVITPDQYLNRQFVFPGQVNPFDWEYCGPCIGEEDLDLKALIIEQSKTLDITKRRAILRVIDDIVLTKDTTAVMTYIQTFARFFNADRLAGQQPTQSGYIEGRAENLWLNNP